MGGQVTSLRPPSSAARSRSETRPTPAWASGAMPTPSSATSTSRSPVVALQPDARRVPARACRATLVSASPAIRYAATSTAAGSAPRSPASTAHREPPLSASRSACWRERADQAAVVEGGRAQVVHEPAYVGDDVLHVLAGARRWSAWRGSGSLVDEQPRRLELVDDAAQRRAEPVVQVAADPAALLLAGDDQPLAALLQLVGQPAGAGRGRRLADQVAEQLLVAAADSRLRSPRAGSTTANTN